MTPARSRATAVVRLLLASVLIVWSAAMAAQVTPGNQRFTARTELVLIDVTVVDRTGAPVLDLRPEDFSVTVANRPRAIHSLEFIAAGRLTVRESPGVAPDRDTTTNMLPTSGRLLLIVVDESNLRVGATQAVLRAAEELLTSLAPGDLVGLARIPDGGGLEFTADRERVREALRHVTGHAGRSLQLGVNVFLSEALDFAEGSRYQWPRALTRECGLPTDPTFRMCQLSMEAAARELLVGESVKTMATVNSLRQLMKALEPARTPVTMVLLSEGLFMGQDPSALSGLAAAGAAARISLNVVRPIPPAFLPGQTNLPIDPTADDALRAAGLEALASQLRGVFHPVSGTGQAAFERISREMSGYYLLGIEPTAEDRSGRDRRVRVAVKRAGAVVRARPTFALPTDAVASRSAPDQELRRMLTALIPTRGLPITLTSRVMPSDERQVRLLVSAEIGGPIREPAPHHVGLVVIDRQGTVVNSHAATVTLSPSRASAASPALFTTSVVLDSGDYSVRLAAINAAGDAGSVHHTLQARLRNVGGETEASDLIVSAEPSPGEFPVFTPSGIVDGSHVAVALELRRREAALRKTTVRFEVRSPARKEPIAAVDAHAVATHSDASTLFSRVFALDQVPAGQYVLRAIVAIDDVESDPLERPFRLVPSDQLAAVELIRQAVEDLQRHAPVSAALLTFVEQAKAGIFAAPPEAASRSAADVAMVTFVAGLSALREGRLATARALFEQTRRSAPGFAGIDAFLQQVK